MTIPRWLTSMLCTRPRLRPGRALLTPTWLAALAVLGVNDHLLKGAGILPGSLTGKLSDLAGMIVAPALLAALLGLRTRRGLLFCHLAVGAVFAAIKVSPAAADAWSWLMGLAGNAWTITVDPTDLIALPMLAIGWRALAPAMARPMPGSQPRRAAQLAAIITGTTLSVATSSPNEPVETGEGEGEGEGDWGEQGEFGEQGEVDGWIEYSDIQADVYLNNSSDADIIIRTRELLPEVQLDCIAIEDDPGLLLSEPVFGAGLTYTMPPRTNAAVRDLNVNPQNRDCYAVRVEGDQLVEPFIVFWRATEVLVEWVPGAIDEGTSHRAGGITLGADADGNLSVTARERDIVHEIDPLPPVDAYHPGADVDRVAWSDPPESGVAMQLTTVDVGPDGCLGLEFDDAVKFSRWYLCVPPDSFPFAQGDWVTVATYESGGVLEVLRVAGPMDPEPPASVAMVVSRGRSLPKLGDTVMAAKAIFDTSIAPDPVCGTVARPSEISVRYEGAVPETARPGDVLNLQGASTTLSLWVAHAEERVLLNAACAEGPDELGADLEIVAVRTPTAP